MRRQGLDTGSAAVRIVDAETGDALPAYDDVAGVVITGSHDMVTERQPWSEQAARRGCPGWSSAASRRSGIRYGHQLLAHALGGEVGDNPNGAEFGTIGVELTSGGRGRSPAVAACPRDCRCWCATRSRH